MTPRSPTTAWPDTIVGLGVLALALVAAWSTSRVPEAAIYATVGPKVFPWITTVMLGGLGALLVVAGLRGGWSDSEEQGEIAWRRLGLLVAGLVVNAAAIEQLGFIIASSLMFVLAARAFDSRTPLRDAATGFALAFVAYVGFDRVLGYRIGSGLIESLF